MRKLIIVLNYFSALCLIVLLYVAVYIYVEDSKNLQLALEANAAKTEALYVSLTGRHGIRLNSKKAP
tara:strand:- start:218 stop:418 length:201 start_codon:yes stop_codon:yes gene_type:complete